jgi:hypothetical protein
VDDFDAVGAAHERIVDLVDDPRNRLFDPEPVQIHAARLRSLVIQASFGAARRFDSAKASSNPPKLQRRREPSGAKAAGRRRLSGRGRPGDVATRLLPAFRHGLEILFAAPHGHALYAHAIAPVTAGRDDHASLVPEGPDDNVSADGQRHRVRVVDTRQGTCFS